MVTTKTIFATLIIFIISSVSVSAATFKISPNRGTFNQNCTSRVDIILDTNTSITNAADIIVDYDPTKIDVVEVIPGNVYTTYFGNVVDKNLGVIKLTGASFVGSFKSVGTFATIQFKPKVNSGTGTFNIRFTGADQYNTLDSNIADINTSNDLLSSVDNGFFAFTSGSCLRDTIPPQIDFVAPINQQQDVPSTANLQVDISDATSGVDINTVELVINGQTYSPSQPSVTTSGNSSLYHFLLKPDDPLFTSSINTLLVKATDFSGNSKTSSIYFNLPPIPPLVCPTAVPTVPVDPSQPTPTINPQLGNIIPLPSGSATPPISPDDVNSPTIEFISPKSNQTTSTKPSIQLHLSDTGSGIDKGTINIKLDDQTFLIDNPSVQTTGNPSSTTIKLTLSRPLPLNSSHRLTVFIADLSGNAVSQTITFYTSRFNLLGIIIFVIIITLLCLAAYYFIKLPKKTNTGQPYGIVFNSQTYEPIPNAKIVVYDSSDKIAASTTSNIFGIFALDLPPERYRFSIIHPGFTFPSAHLRHPLDYPHPYQGQFEIVDPTNPPYLEIPLDQKTPPTKSNSGTIIDKNGLPKTDVCVELWLAKLNRPLYIRYTDNLGQYRFIVPHGKYILKVDGRSILKVDTRHLVGGHTTISQDIQLAL